jgi:hypothetical protein
LLLSELLMSRRELQLLLLMMLSRMHGCRRLGKRPRRDVARAVGEGHVREVGEEAAAALVILAHPRRRRKERGTNRLVCRSV